MVRASIRGSVLLKCTGWAERARHVARDLTVAAPIADCHPFSVGRDVRGQMAAPLFSALPEPSQLLVCRRYAFMSAGILLPMHFPRRRWQALRGYRPSSG